MTIRKKIWPRSISDCCSMTFLLLIVPVVYWFELWVVLPSLYEWDVVPYIFHFFLGNFLMLNIVGNYTYAVLNDTSIVRTIMPVSTANPKDGWRLCPWCETLAPPRSWHCSTCDTCILKRDHHCMFTGCCIGHYNHRYFLMFLFHLFVATVYAFVYNNIFIWSRIDLSFPLFLLKIVFPFAIFMFGFDGSFEQFYLLLYIITTVGMVFTGVLLFYHLNLVLRGSVADESNKRVYAYDLGWKQNVKEVLGERWYLACVNPYAKSSLPHDGITWDDSITWHSNEAKIR